MSFFYFILCIIQSFIPSTPASRRISWPLHNDDERKSKHRHSYSFNVSPSGKSHDLIASLPVSIRAKATGRPILAVCIHVRLDIGMLNVMRGKKGVSVNPISNFQFKKNL